MFDLMNYIVKMKKVLVCGAGGFIGSHLVKHLKSIGYWVRGVDLKYPEFSSTKANEFIIGDLKDIKVVKNSIEDVEEIFQLAADMGGAGYIFSGENDFDIMHNSALININISKEIINSKVKKIFYSSSACIYPEYNQLDPDNPKCNEASAYPADPDSEYGWEKLFSERLYLSLMRNKKIEIRIARFHNIFGPEGTYQGGREKAPAALCRKVILSDKEIEVWGDGKQTRSFLYIDECVEGIIKLMESDFIGPVNIGSDEMISINNLSKMIINISEKKLEIKNIKVKEIGVRGRNSDNKMIKEKLNWSPSMKLEEGIIETYNWIEYQVRPSCSGSPNF
jgi:nucleoside-diphosphate-sugar epimerase